MFLKSLEVFGFKSFADRTRINFSDGITALLGPNGCGKSNVVDAVKWVLGEQAAKTMRAEKMEDVIFNGTESRKALNMAEVSLTISNDTGLLPIDTGEIVIKRRLYRSGEGEYWINNEQRKLKDIRELFWDTGVGKTAYSVMEQGKIDQILSTKPEDRRYLFEEAAGITRFKVKRAEAERKLERTEDNMHKVEVILSEVKKSYDSLKIQADKTIVYRTLKDDIFNFELDLQLLKLKKFNQDKRNREDDIATITKKRDAIQHEIESLNIALSEHLDNVNTLEGKLIEMQQKIYGLAIEERAKNEKLRLMEENRSEAQDKIYQVEGKIKLVIEKIEGLIEDSDEQDTALHEFNKRLTEIFKNITGFEQNIESASQKITENNETIQKIHDEIAALKQKGDLLQADLEAITENIVTELDQKLKEAGYSTGLAKKAQKDVNTLVEKLKIITTGKINLFNDFAAVSEYNQNDVHKMLNTAVESFREIDELGTVLQDALAEYSKIIPDFIEDFLSPQGIITQKRKIDTHIIENNTIILEKTKKIENLTLESQNLNKKIQEYRSTLEQLRINQAQIKAQVFAVEDRIKFLRREITGQETAKRELENDLYAMTKRFEELEEQVQELREEIDEIQHTGVKLTKDLELLEKDISLKNSSAADKQSRLKQLTLDMSAQQEQIEKYHLGLATAETEIRNLKENFIDTHSRDLMEFEEKMFTISATSLELREKLAGSRQALKELGSVNLMAPEEFTETQERYNFLVTQIADLEKARDDLQRITAEIRAESTELFLETYNKIKKNFHNMFRRLFGGGRSELRLTDPQNVLSSGIDIFAQPPGKKLENITLLSGGEKTMTAVSLLFATYMVRPSPFCLLDEIDAALDEKNVLRFVQTLREFGNISQYIVITHNKKTVSGAGTLLGVTMEESGISKLITIRVENDGKGNTYLPEIEPFEEEDVELEKDVFIPPHPPKRIKGDKNGVAIE